MFLSMAVDEIWINLGRSGLWPDQAEIAPDHLSDHRLAYPERSGAVRRQASQVVVVRKRGGGEAGNNFCKVQHGAFKHFLAALHSCWLCMPVLSRVQVHAKWASLNRLATCRRSRWQQHCTLCSPTVESGGLRRHRIFFSLPAPSHSMYSI